MEFPSENLDLTTLDQPYQVAAIRAQELEAWYKLFHLQIVATQDFLENEAMWLAGAIINDLPQVHFGLPERVAFEQSCTGQVSFALIPEDKRHQKVINRWHRLTHTTLCAMVQQRLAELEECPESSVVIAAGLLRFSCGMYMVHHLVHSWWMNAFIPGSERTFSAFVSGKKETLSFFGDSALNYCCTDRAGKDAPKGQEMKPVEGSRQYRRSQKHSIVEECRPVLAVSVNEAEKLMAALQQDLSILDVAVALTPYLVANEEFQQKRYWIIGQLIQQGRALAQFQVREIIQSIHLRAASHLLNRGLGLSLPYFDDHALEMRCWKFQVIPAGRTLFSPAFVVRAVWLEREKLSREPRLSPSTRKHLLEELESLERAFDGVAGY